MLTSCQEHFGKRKFCLVQVGRRSRVRLGLRLCGRLASADARERSVGEYFSNQHVVTKNTISVSGRSDHEFQVSVFEQPTQVVQVAVELFATDGIETAAAGRAAQ